MMVTISRGAIVPRFSFAAGLLVTLALLFGLPADATEIKAEAKAWQSDTPALELKDMQRVKRTLADYKGKVLVLNFWATWCEPCVEEMPSLQKLKKRLETQVNVVGVNLGEGQARIEKFMAKSGVTFPVLLDRDGDAKIAWKVNIAPTTYVLDADGKVRFYYVGQVDFGDPAVEAKIKQLIPKQ